LNISPTNLRAKYQKLINDAKIANKENKFERVEQALASFEEYYDTCKHDIYYALALTSVNQSNQ
jgi:lipid II:glycine glycyltransferase (peptidoglycan interpeptide bridge formation enzyme)